jgi:tetraprenyl-beta-curcumene synthase
MKHVIWKQFPYSLRLAGKFVQEIFPQVDGELAKWRQLGKDCPDEILATQALASIEKKRFHAQGGSIYALYPTAPPEYTRFVVALQTISDYLDNLCDRVGFMDEQGFRQVHQAMLDALDYEKPMADYYLYYPHREDGGYLASLVEECRRQVVKLPTYHQVKEEMLELAGLYCDLQTYKHLPWEVREKALEDWATPYLKKHPDLSCWEFAAATGSTLGIFILGALAADRELTKEEVNRVKEAYFPWICGLHIMLDYFIDQEEDQQEGELNFCFYYRDREECSGRLDLFVRKSFEQAKTLNHPDFHLTVIKGLLAMYLSDGKAGSQLNKKISSRLIATGGGTVKLLYLVCRLLRLKKAI